MGDVIATLQNQKNRVHLKSARGLNSVQILPISDILRVRYCVWSSDIYWTTERDHVTMSLITALEELDSKMALGLMNWTANDCPDMTGKVESEN